MATRVSTNGQSKAEPLNTKVQNDFSRFMEIAKTNLKAMAALNDHISNKRGLIECSGKINDDGKFTPVLYLAKPLAAFLGNDVSHV